ncbi:Nuclear receptor-binding protein [Thelohanellus kitauei]|uniref:Nuclear receptor-binding protein n=1 Tax=Thelohanellus kitauei TaxID=669202 RepID=A0A0C2J8S7_THEKT|nr:Nuclear receptor-binding protein [Thelohanellus kitauei]
MSQLVDDLESKHATKTSPCLRYERFDKSSCNLIGIGDTYMGMDTEECIEVLWVEIPVSFQIETVITNHFDTIIKFKHPCLLKFHHYWMETDQNTTILYFICEFICDTLFHFIKRTQLNDKAVPLKTQVRILKQILFGLGYLTGQNPPFFLPALNNQIIFMTHDGCIKLSPFIPNKYIQSIFLGKEYCRYTEPDDYYQSLLNFCKILHSMACLHYNPETDLQTSVSNPDKCLVEDQINIINMVLHNRNVLISELLKTKLLFCFPSLKFIAASRVLKSGIDVNEYNFEHPPERVFATLVENSKNFNYSEVPSVDIQRFLMEVKQGLHQFTNVAAYDIVRRSYHDSPPIKSPTSCNREANDSVSCQTAPRNSDDTFIHDLGYITAFKCSITALTAGNKSLKKIQISILYSNLYCRIIQREMNLAVDSANSITDDILCEKLVPERYGPYLNSLISYALHGEELSLVLNEIL